MAGCDKRLDSEAYVEGTVAAAQRLLAAFAAGVVSQPGSSTSTAAAAAGKDSPNHPQRPTAQIRPEIAWSELQHLWPLLQAKGP